MKDLTQGRIEPHLLRMGGAILMSMLAGNLFALANLYWLGRLGPEAQAAVTLAGFPVMLLLTLMPVLSVGSGILIAQSVGARDRDRADRIFNEAFGAALLFMLAFGTFAWIERDAFGRLLTADPRAAEMISTYFRWFIPSIVVQLPLYIIAGALEFTGNVRVGTIAQTATVALNAVLSPVLMFGWLGLPALGVAGTGLAAFLACGTVMLGLLAYFLRRSAYLTLRPAIWFSKPRELWGALKIGLPTGIESGVLALYLLAIALILRPFGAADQAAFGVGQRIFQAALLPLMALSSATCVIVGQSHGAGLPDRVRDTLRCGLRVAMVVAPLLLLALELGAPWILAAFTDDAEVRVAGTQLLRIVAITVLPSAAAYVIFAVLSGQGNTRASLFTQLVYAGLVVAAALLLSRLPGFRPAWLWIAMGAAGFVQCAMAVFFLRRHAGRRDDATPATTAPATAAPVELGAAS